MQLYVVVTINRILFLVFFVLLLLFLVRNLIFFCFIFAEEWSNAAAGCKVIMALFFQVNVYMDFMTIVNLLMLT